MGRNNLGDEVLGSLSDSGAQPQGSGNPLDEILGGQAGGTGGLGDLLGALLSGQAGSSGGNPAGALSGQSGAGGLGDLLGALLGGQAGSSGGNPAGALSGQSGAGGLGDLLGSLLGGQAGSSGGDDVLGSLLGGVMGGQSGVSSQPSADLGGVLQVVLGQLLSGKSSGGLSDLLQMAAGGQQIEHQHLQASGLTDEVMAQTGLDADTANNHLTQVIQALGSQTGQR
jgi:hypothetical protein